mgnify:CR=1 FL=1
MAKSIRKSGKRRLPERKVLGLKMLDQAVPYEAHDALFSLIFLANGLPDDFASVLQAQLEIMQEKQIEIIHHGLVAEDGNVHVHISFSQHQLRLICIARPAPEDLIGHAIECAHWAKAEKDVLRAHTHHYFCQYLSGSDNVGEQILTIEKVAVSLMTAGVLGTVDPEAWNCAPTHVLQRLLSGETHQSLVEDPPVEVWAGFAKLFKNEREVWFCSKAFHRWGVVDFAWLGVPAQGAEAFELFRALFSYVRNSDATLKVGDTAQFGENLLLRFGELSEYHEYLQGPLDTLVIEQKKKKNFH